MRSIRERLQEAMDRCRYVKIERDPLRETPVANDDVGTVMSAATRPSPDYGFVLGLGQDWLLLQVTNEFHFDGYLLLRIADIIKLRSNKYERTFEKIFRAEGMLNQVGPNPGVSCDTLQAGLRDLKRIGGNVIIQCEHWEDSEFFIGRLTRVGTRSVSGRYFDPTGQFEDSDRRIPYDRVTLVQWDDEYIRIFSKYTKG